MNCFAFCLKYNLDAIYFTDDAKDRGFKLYYIAMITFAMLKLGR